MSDACLRRRSRQTSPGDAEARTRLISEKLRNGKIDYQHVVWASFFDDPAARFIVTQPIVVAECSSCNSGAKNSQLSQVCNFCRNTGLVILSRDLIRFIRNVQIPLLLLISWACDCAERQLQALAPPAATLGRYQLPINKRSADPILEHTIDYVRHWLTTGQILPNLFSVAEHFPNNFQSRRPEFYLAVAVIRSEFESERWQIQRGLAEVASLAYLATGAERAERRWQEVQLIKYLLCEIF